VNTAVTTGTSDPALYRSNRYDQYANPLTYSFAVANGSYRVNLLFAENAWGLQAVGARVFNVKLNGATVLQNLTFSARLARTPR
jgi:Malectin domain